MYDVSIARSRPSGERQRTIFYFCLAAARDLAWLIAAIGDELRVRRDIRRLAAMDDRMLKDIGLGRCEIEYRVEVSEAAGRGFSWPWAR
jgi:uncharacterized protein YjiS (DUF1127 family)